MPDHIVKAYDKELESLGRKIAEMGGIAEKMLSDAMDALIDFDTRLAQATVDSDPRLDLLQRDIEEQAILTIARRQPMAVDLREIIATIRISGDLERIGDLAKNIAKRAIKLAGEMHIPRCIIGLRSMHELGAVLLKDALDAYAQRDAERARDVWMHDADLDAALRAPSPRPDGPGGSGARPEAGLTAHRNTARRPGPSTMDGPFCFLDLFPVTRCYESLYPTKAA